MKKTLILLPSPLVLLAISIIVSGCSYYGLESPGGNGSTPSYSDSKGPLSNMGYTANDSILISQASMFALNILSYATLANPPSIANVPYSTYSQYLPAIVNGIVSQPGAGIENFTTLQAGPLYNLSADYCGEGASLEVLEYFFSIYVNTSASWSEYYYYGFSDDSSGNYNSGDAFQNNFFPDVLSAQDYIAVQEGGLAATEGTALLSANMYGVQNENEQNEGGILNGTYQPTPANTNGTTMQSIASFLSNHMFPYNYTTTNTPAFNWSVPGAFSSSSNLFRKAVLTELSNNEPVIIEIAIDASNSQDYPGVPVVDGDSHITVVDGYAGFSSQSSSADDGNVTVYIQDPWYNTPTSNHAYTTTMNNLFEEYNSAGSLLVYDQAGSEYTAGAATLRTAAKATSKNAVFLSEAKTHNFKTITPMTVSLPKKYYDLAPKRQNNK